MGIIVLGTDAVAESGNQAGITVAAAALGSHAATHYDSAVDELDHDLIQNNHNLTTDIDHDALTNFVAGEHVLHSGIDMTLTQTADETSITNSGVGQDISASRSWTIGIADDAVLPGAAAVTVPSGADGARPVVAIAQFRYNTTSNEFEGSVSGAWQQFAYSGGAYHDGFSDFVANEHVDHSSVSLTVTGTSDQIDVTGAGGNLTASRSWTLEISDDVILPGTGAMTVPTGDNTAQPGAPTIGMLRYNSEAGYFEGAWAGTFREMVYAVGNYHDGFGDYVANEHIDHSGVNITVSGTANEIAVTGAAQPITAGVTFTLALADDTEIPGSGSMLLPHGTTGERTAVATGQIRYNTTLNSVEASFVGTYQSLAYAGGAFHDGFSDFVADEHIDWTGASDDFNTSGLLTSTGGRVVNHSAENGSYQVTNADFAIGNTGTNVTTLPASPATGQMFFLYNISTGTDVTVSGGAKTIYHDSGAATTMTLSDYEGAIFVYDGTAWRTATKYA